MSKNAQGKARHETDVPHGSISLSLPHLTLRCGEAHRLWGHTAWFQDEFCHLLVSVV